MTENTPLCYGVVTRDYDPWFSDDADDQALARGICHQCPVWATCITHALVNDFPFGIFGGLDPEERAPLREKMFDELPADAIAALTDKYFIPDITEERSNPSVEAKYRRRLERAEQCRELLLAADPEDVGQHYTTWMDCVEAVLDNPTGTGDQLGKVIGGKSSALFNRRLRECFEYFGMDLSVL